MKKFYLLLISFISLNFGYGQTYIPNILAGFGTINVDGTAPSVGALNVLTTGFARSNVSLGGQLNNAYYRTVGWSASSLSGAISAEEYIEWSVTAYDELVAQITDIRIKITHQNGGPQNFKIFYSTDNFISSNNELKSGIETFPNYTREYNSLNINSEVGGTITFRLYAWNAINKTAGQLLIVYDDNWKLPQTELLAGVLVIGSLSTNFNGRLFSNGVWYPSPPATSTNPLLDARILAGTYEEGKNVNIKNLTVDPGAGVRISSTGAIKVHGHLITSDNVLVESTSSKFGSLMVVEYIDRTNPNNSVIISPQVTGKVKYSRFVNDRGDNDLISAPVSGQGFMEFWQTNPNLARNTAGTRFIFGPFDKATGDYVISTDSDNYILEPGIGYRAASEGRDPLIFNGTVSVGDVSVPIEESGTGYKEWNLIGNPYPAFIRLEEFGEPNENLLHELALGVYGYNPANTSKKWEIFLFGTHPDRVIAPGQGFYVAALPGDGNILFEPRMMVASGSDDFIAGRTENKDANSGFLKLNISNEGKNYDTELFFMEQASRGLDPGYDGRVYGKKAGAFAIYSHLVEDSKGTDMAVQSVGYSDLTNGVVIPIGINASEGMQITVNISEFNLPEGTEVRLEDNSNNTFTLLNTSDYTFTATSNLKDIGRFFLHVSTKPLSNKDDILNGLQIYTTNKSKTLYVKGLIKDQAQVNIYDIQGRIMTSASLKANTNSNEVDMSNLSTGIYVAELKSSGSVKTQKVILK